VRLSSGNSGKISAAALILLSSPCALLFANYCKSLENLAVITHRVVVLSALLLLFAHGVYGRGAYQRTRDGRTIVWNDHPAAGYEATWSGGRDRNKYAKGQGTLSWYRVNQPIVTGSNIPSVRRGGTELIARYSGKMVRGKLEGTVERIDADGRTFHAAFVSGNPEGNWSAGPAPRTESGGKYQRAKDGRALVWNEHPSWGYEATWTGKRDSKGYATGEGTLTWSAFEGNKITGSNIPSSRRGVGILDHYSGKMVRGKFEGPVERTDAEGKTFHTAYVNGRTSDDWLAGPAPTSLPEQRHHEAVQEHRIVEARATPAPKPSVRRAEPVDEVAPAEAQDQPVNAIVNEQVPEKPVAKESSQPAPAAASSTPTEHTATAEKPAQTKDTIVELFRPPSSLRTPAVAAASPQTSAASSPAPQSSIAAGAAEASAPSATSVVADSAAKNRSIAEVKARSDIVLMQVSGATGNFREVDRLDSVQKLPATVSQNIQALSDFRSKVEDEAALPEYRTESTTVDALAVVDQATRNIAEKNASAAGLRVTDFLKTNPGPTADNQKGLWRYLTSLRSVCSQSEKQAEAHSQRAQSLVSAGKTDDAIREYEEAYKVFPNPATAETIHRLQNKGAGSYK
jgi:hypothetical protein